jgi:hypothetical protein
MKNNNNSAGYPASSLLIPGDLMQDKMTGGFEMEDYGVPRMKHIIKQEDFIQYNYRTTIASASGKKLNIFVSINDNGKIQSSFEVEIKGNDCFYVDSLDVAIKEYNKY